MFDYLCDECKEHFEKVKEALKSVDMNFKIDSSIVRGLDYYTKTVFEFVDKKSGLTALGGGRYDGLVEEFGGTPTPAVGFASGIERIMDMFEENNKDVVKENIPDVYILSAGENENIAAMKLSENLRKLGIKVEKDLLERSFKAQIKYADKIKARYLIVIGEEELSLKKCKIKNMTTGQEKEVDLEVNKIQENLK